MTSDLESRLLVVLHESPAPRSAKELGQQLNVPGHDVSRVLSALVARGAVTASPRDPTLEASHTNPKVYTLPRPT